MQAARREGVLYVPGEFGHVNEAGPAPACEARLSFGMAGPSAIAEGVRRLRAAADNAVAPLEQQGEEMTSAVQN
jgi:hypothetical protein